MVYDSNLQEKQSGGIRGKFSLPCLSLYSLLWKILTTNLSLRKIYLINKVGQPRLERKPADAHRDKP